MKLKRFKKYLTPTTDEMGKFLSRELDRFLKNTHKAASGGRGLDREKKAIWLYRTDKDPAELPTLVAHLDTVSAYDVAPKANEINWKDGVISLAPESKASCLGGDDRAGVAVIIETVRELARLKKPINFNILFTFGEERGCLGTKQFLSEYKDKFKASFMLEFDRRGTDYVGYLTGNKEFLKKVGEVYDRTESTGSVSDIRHFQDQLKINSANVGVGFHTEHTKLETWNTIEWQNTFEQTLRLMQDAEDLRALGNYLWVDKPQPTYNHYVYSRPKKTIQSIFEKLGEDLEELIEEMVAERVEEELAAMKTVETTLCQHIYDSTGFCIRCGEAEEDYDYEEERAWYNNLHQK